MIVRVNPDNTVVVIDIPPEQEDEFLKVNNTGQFIKVDSLPESKFGCYKLDTTSGNIVVDIEREIEKFKEYLLKQTKQQVEDYILEHYPLTKQNADNQQKDYFGTAILMVRNQLIANGINIEPITVDKIYIIVGNCANKILDGLSTLQNEVSQFPAEEQYYWEQLIKAGVRKAWTIKCVYVYNQIKNQIEQATTLEELEQIHMQIQVLPFPEFPNL